MVTCPRADESRWAEYKIATEPETGATTVRRGPGRLSVDAKLSCLVRFLLEPRMMVVAVGIAMVTPVAIATVISLGSYSSIMIMVISYKIKWFAGR